eukprot:TRINITY_DN8707_c0_g1_i1.p1 TRINITY_DN8707_c0_g1~~TRINITY_DN8707_c0_g1_i1.p1  ORF type:complete len:307 (+),score=71.03 TRINITY_DN8707_c0_g1_i1:171-1091(+)
MEKVSVAIVGPKSCGKTCLMISYTSNAFPGEYLPSTMEPYNALVMIKDQHYNLTVIDTSTTLLDSVGGRQLTAASWGGADVLLFCVDLTKRDFGSLRSEILPIVKAANKPFILVGTKSDKRDGSPGGGVSSLDGEQLALEIGAVKYLETSSLQGKGLKQAFDAAVELHVASKSGKGGKTGGEQKYNLKISVTTGTVSEAQDSNGLADPYLKIKQGVLSSWTSKVQKKTLTPSWNETGIVKLGEPNGKSVSITIELWDQDALKDDFIGHHKVEMKVGSKMDSKELTFVDKSGKTVGTANIALEWVSA